VEFMGSLDGGLSRRGNVQRQFLARRKVIAVIKRRLRQVLAGEEPGKHIGILLDLLQQRGDAAGSGRHRRRRRRRRRRRLGGWRRRMQPPKPNGLLLILSIAVFSLPRRRALLTILDG